ncbi:MAG TPA: PEP-CTERM sorting domain-containing protein [Chthoniobacterales bacterium]
MKPLNFVFSFATSILLFAAPCLFVSAETILDTTASISASDPTQTGRLISNGIAQDWSGGESFPGIVNTSTIYHYMTITIDSSVIAYGPYIQILIDDEDVNIFGSAYAGSYLPNSSGVGNRGFNTNWLGDAGFSGNLVPGAPLFFQVLAPTGSDLVLVFNNTGAGNVGVGETFGVLVESFSDDSYTDPIPEASSLWFAGAGLLGVYVLRRRTASM